ncbi:hypothetical protein SLA2020_517140 [Shorea laevis]
MTLFIKPLVQVSLGGNLCLACLYAPWHHSRVLQPSLILINHIQTCWLGQGLGPVNTLSRNDGFAKLKDTVPWGVMPGKGTNTKSSASSRCGADFV